ncbi:ras-related and estrogen-regulated growth inhibitor-like protein [Argiope bruennichi]|uniref:small monomeric GTPase n=1 Tax=Argiope bruennichi TaxID=94029 RepID=A0A8T0FTC6_ARGBR|nr:ras-related and estrogen-regulated growth inhibitor-like protein [Argiope bruennichi]KAF8791943.1 Ras-related and estrogen-regulated growth like protein [Argiope bruennichi]
MMQKLPFVRILVLGAQEVGKTAVTVRFLTQRFIGEYDSQKDFVYSSTTPVTGFPVEVEIIDTSRDQTDNIPVEKLLESTAFIVVYSISSKSSFLIAADCVRNLQSRGQPILLLANKRDLEHIREVSTEEGQQLARELGGVYFAEVSAAESYPEVVDAFRMVLSDACSKSHVNSSPTNTTSRRKKSVVSVSKIISAMFGRSSSGLVSDSHNQKKRPSLSL